MPLLGNRYRISLIRRQIAPIFPIVPGFNR